MYSCRLKNNITVIPQNVIVEGKNAIKNPAGVQAGSEELKRRTSGQAPVLTGVSVVTQIVLSEELPPHRAR